MRKFKSLLEVGLLQNSFSKWSKSDHLLTRWLKVRKADQKGERKKSHSKNNSKVKVTALPIYKKHKTYGKQEKCDSMYRNSFNLPIKTKRFQSLVITPQTI